MSLRPATAAFRITAIVLTVVFILSEAAGLRKLDFISGNAAHNIGIILAYWLDMLPNGFCLAALWVATNVFGRLSRGDAFNAAMVKGLRGIGLNLILSALSAIVIVPFLKPLALDLGTWGHSLTLNLGVNINVESATIGVIGLVLYMVAHQGRTLKTELESFV
jgi:hypothetical protein